MTQTIDSLTVDQAVALREITSETLYSILRLKVSPEQDQFVANNSNSIAEAYFEPKAWFRAIYAGETPVGFLMLLDNPDKPEYYLWRFMIDSRYQRMGYGRQALNLLIEYVRARPNARELILSYSPGAGSPEPFYEGLGFVNTGEVEDEENVMKLVL